MSYNVTISPSGKQFEVDAETSVLEAALDAGIVLPYGCKNGACGSCKSLVTEGSVVQGDHQASALSSSETTQGYALLCTAKATSDLQIEATVVAGAGTIPVRKCRCGCAASGRWRQMCDVSACSCRSTSGCSICPASTWT